MKKLSYQSKIKYLKKADPVLGKILVGKIVRHNQKRSVYETLLSSIISQQISVSAASSIKKRFLNIFNDKYPDYKKLIGASDEILRSSGLSKQKISYLKNVAIHFQIESLDEKKFLKMSDEEVMVDLTRIKGVGTWTVEMLLMFTLKREDVFSIKDGGLVNAVCSLYKINKKTIKNKILENKILKISKNWTPYRTLVSLYLWQYKDSTK